MKRRIFTCLLAVLLLLSTLPATAQSPRIITPGNADQVVQFAIVERGWINRIAWAADSSTLAIAAPSGVWFADFASDLRLMPFSSEALSLAYSADGSRLAVGTAGGTVEVVDPVTDQTISTIPCAERWINDVAISPDGSLVVCTSVKANYTGLWRVDDPQEIEAWGGSGPVAFPSNSLFGMETTLWNVNTRDHVATVETDYYQDSAFSPEYAVLVTNQGVIEEVDIATQQQRLLFDSEGSQAWQHLAISPDGQQLAANVLNDRWGSALLLIDLATGTLDRVLENPYLVAYDLAYSPDGTRIAAATTAGHVVVWDVASGEVVHDLGGFNEGGASRGGASSDVSGVTDLTFSPAGMLAIGTGGYVTTSGAVHVWNPVTLVQQNTFAGEGTAWSLSYSPDSARLAVSNSFEGLRVLDAKTGEVIRTLNTPGDVLDTVFGPEGQLAVVYSDGSAQMWDVTTGHPGSVQPNPGGETGLGHVAISPDGRWVAFNNVLWDTTTGNVRMLDAATVTDLAFSPDGALLAVASLNDDYSGVIDLWDVASGDRRMTLAGLYSVAFSPDGLLLASGADSGGIRLWNLSTGEVLATLPGHLAAVNNLAFSPDGTLLASGSLDGTARLWGVRMR